MGNREFGEFLRSRRARLFPADVGLSSSGRRRAVGLRREEVARLAHISTEWYVKLEQGRVIAPSDQTLQALTRALQLTPVDGTHLKALARAGKTVRFVREDVPSALELLVAGLSEPAYLTGECWDLLAWNTPAADLFPGLVQLPESDRNVLFYMLTVSSARKLFGKSWVAEARRMVSLFRASFDLRGDDPAFMALVQRLSEQCAEFPGWWIDHAVATPVSGEKRLMHPRRGPLCFMYSTFQANDMPALKLALYLEKPAEGRQKKMSEPAEGR